MSLPTAEHETDTQEGVRRTGNTFLGDVWVNFRRWNLKAVRNPFVLVVSLVQPVIFLVLFTEVFGNVAGEAVGRTLSGVGYETFLVPAIAIQVALAAAVTSGVGLVNDISTFTPPSPEAAKPIQQAQTEQKSMGVGDVVRVVAEETSTVTENAFQRRSRKAGYEGKTATSVRAAERQLN